TPRTRCNSVSGSGGISSMKRTLLSITQISASRTSAIWLVVRAMMPAKIDTCCAISTVAKATPKMMPKDLLRSPVSILSAIQFMARLLVLRGVLRGRECRLLAQRAQRDRGDMFRDHPRIQLLEHLLADQQRSDGAVAPVKVALADDAEREQDPLRLGRV